MQARPTPSGGDARIPLPVTVMRTSRVNAMLLASLVATLVVLATGPVAAQAAPVVDDSWATVQQALGGRGGMQPGGVLKFGFPRTDLQVIADGVTLKPALALGSWIAFKRTRTGAADVMVMGDLVLTENEVGPAMLALQRGGVAQTALHNHVLHESPRIMYMHVAAHGDAARIAATIRTALNATGTPVPSGPSTTPAPAAAMPIGIDTAAIAHALGNAGKVNSGVYQVSVPRRARIMEHGMEIPPSMGVATAINFQPTGEGKAAITGDFVMTADEVNPVIRALREHDIEVTALHSHMLGESPRLFFMHFWAKGDAAMLATGLRAALDRTAVHTSAR